jgi:predicted nucleotide-binding protein
MPRREAEGRLQAQIEKGKQLLQLQIRTQPELDGAEGQQAKWSAYNRELLRRMVDTEDLVNDYHPGGTISLGRGSLQTEIQFFYQDVTRYINRLESILERLDLFPESSHLVQPAHGQHTEELELGDRVFVVHGHDEEAKQAVARCIEKLGLEAVILHEQPNQGRTIIEKFEDYAGVGFAVVLLTPDDVGAARADQANLRPRARQNVVLELGFFIGRLGRQRVCALHRGDVELPSDLSGVLWLDLDRAGAWRLRLAREMKEAGLDVDLNRLA